MIPLCWSKLQKISLRGYMLTIIIADIFFLALSFYGQLGLYNWLTSRNTVYQNFFLAELVFMGMLATTNIIALPAVITRNRQQAKAWRILLLPHVIANICMIKLREVHCIYYVAVSKYKRDWYHFVGSFFPYVAWNTISAVVAYSYFRSVALYNEIQAATGDEESQGLHSVKILCIRFPNIKLKLRWYTVLINCLNAFFTSLTFVSLVKGAMSWIKEVSSADYRLAVADAVLLALLILTDVISLPAALQAEPMRAKKLRVMLLPNIVLHILVIVFNTGHCIYMSISSDFVQWHYFVASFFPFLAWHIFCTAVVFAYFSKVTSYNLVTTGFSTYGELQETYGDDEPTTDEA